MNAMFDIDSVYGAIVGAAIGDAVGSTTRGRPPRGADEAVAPGRLTPAALQMVAVMRAMLKYDGSGVQAFLAQELRSWARKGFPEIKAEAECDPFTKLVLDDPNFTKDPRAAANAVRVNRCNNFALTRAIPAAFVEGTRNWAGNVTIVTHTDPACLFAAVFVAELVAQVAHGRAQLTPQLLLNAVDAAKAVAPKKLAEDAARAMIRTTRLEDIAVADREGQNTPQTAMAVAVWGFRLLLRASEGGLPGDDFEKYVTALARRGGGATVNCAVLGAVLGAAIGYSALPAELVAKTPHVEWLVKEIAAFTKIASIAEAKAEPEEKRADQTREDAELSDIVVVSTEEISASTTVPAPAT
ncbi:MAG: ADP-ribosylglycohydrolase family protein [Patescibacteria group bacterium]|nr:ADP-ribosylglycohydrolase family protein [Patescibacteria group bacterium]